MKKSNEKYKSFGPLSVDEKVQIFFTKEKGFAFTNLTVTLFRGFNFMHLKLLEPPIRLLSDNDSKDGIIFFALLAIHHGRDLAFSEVIHHFEGRGAPVWKSGLSTRHNTGFAISQCRRTTEGISIQRRRKMGQSRLNSSGLLFARLQGSIQVK